MTPAIPILFYAALVLGGVFITLFFWWSFGTREPRPALPEKEERHPYREWVQREEERTCERCGARWVTKQKP
jgi:hypothetical protein